jgi:hypothetical protein
MRTIYFEKKIPEILLTAALHALRSLQAKQGYWTKIPF